MLSSLRLLVILYSALGTLAQSSNSLVCIPNQCLQGSSDITIGESLLTPSVPLVQLLPGDYTRATDSQLLHILESTTAGNLSQSPGFNLSSFNPIPLNISLQAGFVIYSNPLYAGQATFSPLPSTQMNSSLPLPASSLALSKNVWMAITSGSSNNSIIFWHAVPDVSQLPSAASQSLALVDIQSFACSPPCSGSAVCSPFAKCVCRRGFTGSSCEACANGFFGPTCQPCPSQCQTCDQGISGSGQCLVPLVSNAPTTCNCLNGHCGTDGNCACNIGWIKDANGTACAQCAPGFFLNSAGDCLVCQIGCTKCAAKTANCLACQRGFTQDPDDKTKCSPSPIVTSGGTQCPDGSYDAGDECADCSPSCKTCNGPSSNNCFSCPVGQALFNGNCVTPDANGVCEGTGGMIADNNKQECDACGAKCSSCEIPNFNAASTVSQLQCTNCLPGSFLSQGRCVGSCPSGTFVSPKDNLTCTACSSPCATCVGSASSCLTCKSPQLAFSGQCVSTCPTGTVRSSGACLKCHPDCASCSGSSFRQCSTCFPTRPVLSSGRCLPTCAQSQFFDLTNSTCRDCDSSCSSCSGPGSANCLACSSPTQVLRAGSCVSVNCVGSSNVVPNLGVCLSHLVQVSSVPSSITATATSSSSSSSFSSAPTSVPSSSSTGSALTAASSHQVTWWQILLMVLAGVFIIVVIVVLWRRYMRKQRVEETVKFADAKERARMRQLRERWLEKKDEYYPEGLSRPSVPSMAYPDDFDLRSPIRLDLNRYRDSCSVYSQELGMASRGPGTVSIRNSV